VCWSTEAKKVFVGYDLIMGRLVFIFCTRLSAEMKNCLNFYSKKNTDMVFLGMMMATRLKYFLWSNGSQNSVNVSELVSCTYARTTKERR